MRVLLLVTSVALVVAMSGCMAVSKHRDAVRDDSGDRLTVGVVQKEIRVGMSGADVVAVLGAPNMVTTDSKRRETWVYDKIATENAYSSSSGGVNALIFGGGVGRTAGGLGGIGTGFEQNTGVSSTTQRTLTVIIKYDENSLVRDFAYRTSSF